MRRLSRRSIIPEISAFSFVLLWSIVTLEPLHAQPSERVARRFAAARSDGTLDLNRLWSNGRAVGKGPVPLTHSPMRVEDIERIVPCGLMVGGHVCPIDHGYFFPRPLSPGEEHCDVLAPADGFVVMIAHRTKLVGATEQKRDYDDYSLVIEHTGTFYSQFDLLTALAPGILAALDDTARDRFASKSGGPPIHVRIPVSGGQVVGKVGGRSLDFSVVNSETRLPGLLDPAMYGHYAWRVHVVDPFDYFDEPLRAELLQLNVRKVKPHFGRIDYDIDGRLVGNWFREGSGGYAGDRRDPRGYWMGHLAFAYHHVDPSTVIVSIGDYAGRPRQFTIFGSSPDPADVTAASGLVRYELANSPLDSSGRRIELPREWRGKQGTILCQLLANRRLKMEVVPDANAEVEGFTNQARIYER